MAALLVGIAIILLVSLIPVPYVLYIIGLIVGIVLALYGLYVLLIGHTRTGRRWY